MAFFANEQDIKFCVDAIDLIKNSNATFVKKDTSTINDQSIEVYKNSDNEVVVKFKEVVYVKAKDPQDCYEEQPYKGSPLEKKHQLEQATLLLKKWIDPRYNYEECLHLTEEFLSGEEEEK